MLFRSLDPPGGGEGSLVGRAFAFGSSTRLRTQLYSFIAMWKHKRTNAPVIYGAPTLGKSSLLHGGEIADVFEIVDLDDLRNEFYPNYKDLFRRLRMREPGAHADYVEIYSNLGLVAHAMRKDVMAGKRNPTLFLINDYSRKFLSNFMGEERITAAYWRSGPEDLLYLFNKRAKTNGWDPLDLSIAKTWYASFIRCSSSFASNVGFVSRNAFLSNVLTARQAGPMPELSFQVADRVMPYELANRADRRDV